jgi:hypothetical protein
LKPFHLFFLWSSLWSGSCPGSSPSQKSFLRTSMSLNVNDALCPSSLTS